MANEIETTGKEKETAIAPLLNEMDFVDLLQGELGLSPLATGEKFESDDIVKADSVRLWAFDWVEYIENEGTDKEKNVRFALWKTTIVRKGVTVEGYYQGGVVLNKLATAIGKKGLEGELAKYGVGIKAEWGKTSSKNEILLITIVK